MARQKQPPGAAPSDAMTTWPELPWAPSGLLETEDPATVQYRREKGYAWPSFDRPIDYHFGASSLGQGIDNWENINRAIHARAAAKHRGQLASLDEDGAARLLREEFAEASDLAMKRGRRFHGWTACLDAGIPPESALPPDMAGWQVAWETFKAHYKPDWVAIERTLAAPHIDVMGTADRICRFPEGTVLPGGLEAGPQDWFVLDIKTSSQRASGVKPSLSYAMQLCALGQATHIAIEEQQREYVLPVLAGGLIVTVTPQGKPHVRRIDIHNPVLTAMVVHRARARRLQHEAANSDLGPVEVLQPEAEVPEPLGDDIVAGLEVAADTVRYMHALASVAPERAAAANEWCRHTYGVPVWSVAELPGEQAVKVRGAVIWAYEQANGQETSEET